MQKKFRIKMFQVLLDELRVLDFKRNIRNANSKLSLILLSIKLYFLTVKRCLWNKRLRLWWYRLWIRKDEFHKSLDMDIEAMLVMNKKEREAYIKDLIKRRDIAHRRENKKAAKNR